MSSDTEFEPTPPKHRRLTNPTMCNSSDDSDSPVHKSLRSGCCNKIVNNDDDFIVLSDSEIGSSSQSGTGNSGSQSNSENSTTAKIETSVANDKVPRNKKESLECRKNEDKDGAASSSTGNESDSNYSQAEKCPICWLHFTNQEVATPSTCDHRFCFHCLMEWSKTTNTCPVDRQTYNNIEVRPEFGSKATRTVPVETRVNSDVETEEPEVDDEHFITYTAEEIMEHDIEFPIQEYLNNSEDEDSMPYTFSTEDLEPPSEDEMDRIEAINQSSDELETTFSSDEEDNSIGLNLVLSSSNDNDTDENSVVLVNTSSDEEVHSSNSSSECHELSSSSSSIISPPNYSSDLSTSCHNTSQSSSSSPICNVPPSYPSSSSPCTSPPSSSASSPLHSPSPSPSIASFSSYSSVSASSSSSS